MFSMFSSVMGMKLILNIFPVFFHGPTIFYQGRCSLQLAAMLVTTELTVGAGDYGQGNKFSISYGYFSHS